MPQSYILVFICQMRQNTPSSSHPPQAFHLMIIWPSAFNCNLRGRLVLLLISLSLYSDVEGCEHGWRKFHGHCYRYEIRWCYNAEKKPKPDIIHSLTHCPLFSDKFKPEFVLNVNSLAVFSQVLQPQTHLGGCREGLQRTQLPSQQRPFCRWAGVY